MAKIGFTLSSEEHEPQVLLRQAVRAERAGFGFAMISDHYHPWIDRQGNAPFVWGVLGGLSQVTNSLPIGTGVTCPTTRMHPAIIAQAAATAATMLPGRFSLGVGSGERLNEHILGDPWPAAQVRQERLEEAVEVIRELWTGELVNHRGKHYTVDNARLYTVPEEPPPILVAAGGEAATELAGRVGDGMVGLIPEKDVIEQFDEAGGADKPKYGQLHVCWGPTEEEAVAAALEWWPNSAVGGNLYAELPLPSHFEDAASTVDEEDIAESIVCGPETSRHIAAIQEYVDAGYTHVYVHQVGPDREEFFEFYSEKVLPRFA